MDNERVTYSLSNKYTGNWESTFISLTGISLQVMTSGTISVAIATG